MKQSFLLIIISVIIFSCREQEKGTLKLKILNEYFNSYTIKDLDHYRSDISENKYKSLSKNIIKFKIENKSDTTYILFFNNKQRNYFPERFTSIGFGNMIFRDKQGNPPEYSNTLTSPKELYNDFIDYQDIIRKEYYDNSPEFASKTDSWKYINADVFKSKIVIHPREILYFETFTYLPYKWNVLKGDYDAIIFDTEKEYEANLSFEFYRKNEVEKFLTELQKKEIKDNNYYYFKGDLMSDNKIPVKFIE